MLSTDRRSQLDGIVQKMVANKEDDATVQFVVDDFKKKYESENATKSMGGFDALSKAATGVTDALGLHGAVDTLGNSFANIGNAFNPSTSLQQKVDTAKNLPQSTMEQNVGTGLQLGTLFAPGIGEGGLAARMGVGAAVGGLGLGGQAMAENRSAGDVVKKGAIGTAIGGVIPLAAEGIKQGAKAIYKSVFPYGVREAGQVQNYRANVPLAERLKGLLTGTSKAPNTAGDTAFNQGFVGTEAMVGVQGTKAKNALWKEVINPALSQSDEKVDMHDLFQQALGSIIKNTKELGDRNSRFEALAAIADDYKSTPSASLSDLQGFKEGWASHVPEKYYNGKDITQTYNNVRAELADIARNKIYSALGPDVKQAYFDYGNLKAIQELGKKAMTGGKLKGGFGSFWSGVRDMALTPVATLGGQILYKTANGIEMYGPKGLQKVSQIFDAMNAPSQLPLQESTGQKAPQEVSSSQNTNIAIDTIKGIPGELMNPSEGSLLKKVQDFNDNLGGKPSAQDMAMNFGAAGTAKAVGKAVGTPIQQAAERFVAAHPPYGLLKDMERYIILKRDGIVPKGEMNAAAFEANLRDALTNFGANVEGMNEKSLISHFEAILNVAEHYKYKHD